VSSWNFHKPSALQPATLPKQSCLDLDHNGHFIVTVKEVIFTIFMFILPYLYLVKVLHLLCNQWWRPGAFAGTLWIFS